MFDNIVNYLTINSSRKYLDEFAKKAAASVSKGALVLDAGAGNCLYKHHFSHAMYESADFCQVKKSYGKITHVCDLSNIPVNDSQYDLIFCSQTLEHIPSPLTALKEFYRVLKPGSYLWLSAPFFYEEHEIPYDFYRYTQYGFAYLLKAAGFSITRIEWLEGYYGTLSYELKMAGHCLPMRPKFYGGGLTGVILAILALFLKPLFIGLGILFAQLDLRYKYVSKGNCKNYAIVAVK